MKKSLIFVGMLVIGFANAQYEGKVGVNTETPSATFNVKSKTGNDATTKNLELENASGTKMVTVLDNGRVGIGTDVPTEKLSVFGGKLSITGNGTYTGYLEDVHLRFNRPTEAYLSNLNEKGNLAFMTGGNNIRMFVRYDGRVGIGVTSTPTMLTVKGSSNYGVLRILSEDANTESTIGYGVFGGASEKTWITGVNPNLGDAFFIAQGGQPKLFITKDNIGIGTNTPSEKLEVKGNIKSSSLAGTGNRVVYADENGVLKVGNAYATNTTNSLWTRDEATNTIKLAVNSDGTDRTNAVTIDNAGAVYASSLKGYNGATIFPDYVFQKYYTGNSSIKADYTFKTLSQVEDFVKTNGHLPGYKSAEAIKAQGYVDLMETQLTNVEKIEELYLHSIEQEKAIKAKDAKIQELESRLEKLEKLLK